MIKIIHSLIFIVFISSSVLGQKKEFDRKYKHLLEIAWSDLDSSKSLLKTLKQISKKINEPEYNAYCSNAQGVIFYIEENYPEAHKYYQIAYLEAKKWGDHRFMGIMLNNIGACFVEEKNAHKKIEYLEQAKEEFILVKDDEWLVNVEYNLGVAYYFNGQFQEANKSFEFSKKYYLKLNDSISASYAIGGIGSIYLDQKDYSNSLIHLAKAIDYLDKEYDPETYANLLNKLGQAQLESGLLEKSKENLYSALVIAQQIESILEETRSYELLREYYKINKNLDSALHYSNLATVFGDSLKWSKYNADFAANETKFNTQLKNEKIALQKKNIDQQKASITRLAVLSILLGLIIIGIIVLWLRLNKRSKQLQVALTEKDVLLREIHHRVKNNMQVVSSLLNMHVRKVKDKDSKRILEDGSERIQAMALIQKNLYPHSDLKSISLNEYLHTLSHQLFENYNIYDSKVQMKTQLDEIYVDVEKLIPIGLIVNEILCNSVKHAFKQSQEGEITLKLIDAGSKIQLEIGDSGQNFPENWDHENNESLGMKFIKIFSHKLQASVNIRTVPTTLITLNFPRI
jgi:two-component system, sensor histidine kinase PdtaS